MKMNSVEVCLMDGEIFIIQEAENGEQQSIALTADQAEFFCEWVLDAARSMRSAKNEI